MKTLSQTSRLYLLVIYLAGAAVLSFNLGSLNIAEPFVFAALCGLGSILHILKVEGATNRSHYTFSFLIFGFAIVYLPHPQALLVILVSNLAEWAWHRLPWHIQFFNISCDLLSAQTAFFLYERLNAGGDLTSGSAVLAIGLAMTGFMLVNHLLVGTILRLVYGETFKGSGLFDFLSLAIDLIMLTTGAGLALAWNYNPYALVMFLAPLYPIYISLKIPALERKTEIDQKTGLFNHHYFMTQLRNELQRANRYDRPLAVIMADLDLLRNINNTYGHLAGDEVLKGVADILKRSVREYDVIARFGGEEFAILLPEMETDKAIERAELIRREVENAAFDIPTSIQPIRATLSVGVATREDFVQTAEEIIHNADMALYNSKLKGRNRAYAYTHSTFKRLEVGPANAVYAVETRPIHPQQAYRALAKDGEYSTSFRRYSVEKKIPSRPAATRRRSSPPR